MKRLPELFLVLVLIAPVILAQTGNVTTSVKTSKSTKTPGSEIDQLRLHQLRVLREHVLTRTLDGIKKMDEVALRLSARNQVLTYLTSDTAPSDEKQTLATQLATDAIVDLREHGEEIVPFMFGYLSNDLGSWIQKYRPNLNAEFEKAVKKNVKVDESQRIRSLFELEHGDLLAAKRIRQELDEAGPLNGLQFWLDELQRRKSTEFEPLAAEIVERGGRGQVSFETLFWVSDIYLRSQTPESLKSRFLAMIVTRTQLANFAAEQPPQMAYDLLSKILPYVQRSIPELYDQALNQNVAMRAMFNEKQLAIEARNTRLKESANPIEDLISEAESVKSKTERNELLLQAAQLAMEKKKFDMCLHILTKVDLDLVRAEPDSWQRSIDQVLKNFVTIVLVDKRAELAEKAAGRIASLLTKVVVVNQIIRSYLKANDNDGAQRLLTEASKVAASGPDNTDKAKAFFLLSLTSEQVDRSKKTELLLSGINALNGVPKPDSERDKANYQGYVQRLDNSGYELTKGFKGLTKQDENTSLALVEKIHKPDLRTLALIGILLGL